MLNAAPATIVRGWKESSSFSLSLSLSLKAKGLGLGQGCVVWWWQHAHGSIFGLGFDEVDLNPVITLDLGLPNFVGLYYRPWLALACLGTALEGCVCNKLVLVVPPGSFSLSFFPLLLSSPSTSKTFHSPLVESAKEAFGATSALKREDRIELKPYLMKRLSS